MKHGDPYYNYHFKEMVLTGLCCGLTHPVEWVENYSRGIGVKYSEYGTLTEFCDLAIKELYATTFCRNIDEVTMADCNIWINKHYNQR